MKRSHVHDRKRERRTPRSNYQTVTRSRDRPGIGQSAQPPWRIRRQKAKEEAVCACWQCVCVSSAIQAHAAGEHGHEAEHAALSVVEETERCTQLVAKKRADELAKCERIEADAPKALQEAQEAESRAQAVYEGAVQQRIQAARAEKKAKEDLDRRGSRSEGADEAAKTAAEATRKAKEDVREADRAQERVQQHETSLSAHDEAAAASAGAAANSTPAASACDAPASATDVCALAAPEGPPPLHPRTRSQAVSPTIGFR